MRNRFPILIGAIGAVSVGASQATADLEIFRVDGDNGSAQGDGQAWGADAILYLQDALAAAATWVSEEGNTAEIWVAATDPSNPYFPDRDASNPSGTGDRSASFELLDNGSILGGFVGDEQAKEERNPDVNVTTLSGDIGTTEDETDNSYHVVTSDLNTAAAVLDGFTVTAGNADSSVFAIDQGGGGIRIGDGGDPSHPLIIRCRFKENTASLQGGGGGWVNSPSSSPSRPQFWECVFEENSATDGGGLKCEHAEAVAILCTFLSNDCATAGGAVFFSRGASLLVDCTLDGNGGNALAGGGIAIDGAGDAADPLPHMINTVAVRNSAIKLGGGVFVVGSSGELNNCTIADNTVGDPGPPAVGWGGGYYELNDGGEISLITNSILWGNSAFVEGDQIHLDGGDGEPYLTVRYSDVEGGESEVGGDPDNLDWGDNNIDLDPLFPTDGYRLTSASPCIESGTNNDLPCDEYDVDDDGEACGSPSEPTPDRDEGIRVLPAQGIVDMGAYEFDACACPSDIDEDGSVGFTDLLQVLNDWGPCPLSCPADIDDDGTVGFTDMLSILSDWGTCPCGTGPGDDCADRDLGANCECRDTLTDLIENGTQSESENARCWLDHYIACHDAQGCNSPPDCPDDDPCGKH